MYMSSRTKARVMTLSLKLAGNLCDSRHPRPQMTVPAAMFEDDRHTGFELHFIGEPMLSLTVTVLVVVVDVVPILLSLIGYILSWPQATLSGNK